MRLPLALAAAGLAFGLVACSKQTAVAAPDAVDRMPRAEVEAIVKDYLVNNPEVVNEVLASLTAHEQSKIVAKLTTNKDDPTIGPENAPVTIVEFFDYNCGYCHAAYPWLFKHLDDKRQDIRVIFKEMPILAESSLLASQAALAADRQGKYREMHLALMKSKDLSQAGIEKIGQSIGLDVEKLKKDMESDQIMAHIAQVAKESEDANVRGTPGFFINGQFLNGFDEATLDKMIEDARAKS
jgi:protein-disulfide isomerase